MSRKTSCMSRARSGRCAAKSCLTFTVCLCTAPLQEEDEGIEEAEADEEGESEDLDFEQ